MPHHVYAVKHNNIQIRQASRSGGVFTALSDTILRNGGVVYGCKMKDPIHAVHSRAENSQERDEFHGSKYIQSDLENSFSKIRFDLIQKKQVLVSGTPCQINALKKFLKVTNIDTERLFTIDIVCHGVPSPAIWRDYVQWNENKAHEPVLSVDFRDKSYGWNTHLETLRYASKKKTSDVYTRMFYGHNMLRPSCSTCPFASTERISDITIADFWGINEVFPDFDDNQGVSLVLINTERGEKLFYSSSESLDCRETTIEHCIQPPLEKPFPMPDTRNQFWTMYKCKTFHVMTRTYGGNNFRSKSEKKWRNLKLAVKEIVRSIQVV